jgi:hypothetical protein
VSRSGYNDYCDSSELNLWRGAVDRALRGKRGQAFLREMATALDAMPEKALAADVLADSQAGCCAMGAVARARGIDTTGIDEYDRETVAGLFGIAPAMAAEIAYENDEGRYDETPEQRWTRMREWVRRNIKAEEGRGDAD